MCIFAQFVVYFVFFVGDNYLITQFSFISFLQFYKNVLNHTSFSFRYQITAFKDEIEQSYEILIKTS